MKELLDEYKKTAKQTRTMQKNLSCQIEDCEKGMESVKDAAQHPNDGSGVRIITAEEICYWDNQYKELKLEKKMLKREREIVGAMVSSLAFSIHCIRYNVEPPVIRGIERRAYYEREVPFGNEWIEKRQDEEAYTGFSIIEDEPSEDAKYRQEIHKELVKEIKKCLTPRQIEVMELVGENFESLEIAKMLGISKRAVNYAIEMARQKVKDEGWRMV